MHKQNVNSKYNQSLFPCWFYGVVLVALLSITHSENNVDKAFGPKTKTFITFSFKWSLI